MIRPAIGINGRNRNLLIIHFKNVEENYRKMNSIFSFISLILFYAINIFVHKILIIASHQNILLLLLLCFHSI